MAFGEEGLQGLGRGLLGVQADLVPESQALRGLSFTFDYYHVDVDNVIGTIGVSAILAGCYPGAGGTQYTPYCDLIHRSSFTTTSTSHASGQSPT